jgi:hypothetical protein
MPRLTKWAEWGVGGMGGARLKPGAQVGVERSLGRNFVAPNGSKFHNKRVSELDEFSTSV